MNNENEEFDLFATEVEDNLQETLAKGSYKWTNKYTAILGALVIVTGAVSGGIWYGNKHSTTSNAINGIASRIRGAAAGGAFTGAAGAAGGFDPAAAAAGGFGGGSRISGTVTKVNGTTVTITLDAAPATPIASGDVVSIRATSAAGAAPAAGAVTGSAATGSAGSSKATNGSKKSGASAAGGTTSTKPTIGGVAPSGAPRAGGGGGGRFSNPAFTDCLAKAGVTLAPGARPDRTDPKVAAALTSCASTLGLGAGGGAPGGGTRPAPTATP